MRRFGSREERYHAIKAVGLSADGKTAAAAHHFGYKGNEQEITLWETETGRKRCSFRGHIGLVSSVALSADGRFLVSASDDTTALVWDVTRLQARKGAARRDLTAALKDLADENAERVYGAEWALVDSPKEAVSFLEKRDELFAATDVPTVQRWIRDLDSDKYADRERASQELAWIVDEAGPHLTKALEGSPSAEARRRIELLLQKRSVGISGKELHRFRVIEVLEHIAMDATPGADASRLAVQLLRKFAGGDSDSRTTLEAKATLERLESRAKSWK
jgi:hypothetical protein